MSIFGKIASKLGAESTHLKKIRKEAEERRSGKPTENKADDEAVISRTLNSLSARIGSGKYK